MSTPPATSPQEWPPGQPSGWPDGWRVEVVDETGSTNADLLAAARAGAPDRSVLMARHQTAGRGRLDRRWDAPPGANLLVSVLFTELPDRPHELTQRIGVAAIVAAQRVAGVAATLKWPNDLLVDGRKLAGILAQAELGARPAVVVGLGMNVGWAPEGAARLGDGIEPATVLRALLTAYDELPADVWPVYRSHLGTLGRSVRAELPDGSAVEGRAIDVEPDGRLVVLDECGISHRFDVADVVHLR